jgi:hypothetical protein
MRIRVIPFATLYQVDYSILRVVPFYTAGMTATRSQRRKAAGPTAA